MKLCYAKIPKVILRTDFFTVCFHICNPAVYSTKVVLDQFTRLQFEIGIKRDSI